MFNYHEKMKQLFVNLPDLPHCDFDFLDFMTYFIYMVNSFDCEEVYISCNSESVFDKMSLAYIHDVCKSFVKTKTVYYHKDFSNALTNKVNTASQLKFEKVSLIELATQTKIPCYKVEESEDISGYIENVVDILSENNLCISTDDVKEYLTTTIGEIFSNCFNHSNQNELRFMFDLDFNEDKILLRVNVVDYGTTIATNVRKHERAEFTDSKCIEWAIQLGNTTRDGSGGYGLPMLIEYIKKTNGMLHIFSGKAYYSYIEQEEKIDVAQGFFDGTSVTFMVSLFSMDYAIAVNSDNKQLVNISLANV